MKNNADIFFAIFKIQCSLSLRSLILWNTLENWFLNSLLRTKCKFYAVENFQHEIGKIHNFLLLGMGPIFGPNLKGVMTLTSTNSLSLLKEVFPFIWTLSCVVHSGIFWTIQNISISQKKRHGWTNRWMNIEGQNGQKECP